MEYSKGLVKRYKKVMLEAYKAEVTGEEVATTRERLYGMAQLAYDHWVDKTVPK